MRVFICSARCFASSVAVLICSVHVYLQCVRLLFPFHTLVPSVGVAEKEARAKGDAKMQRPRIVGLQGLHVQQQKRQEIEEKMCG